MTASRDSKRNKLQRTKKTLAETNKNFEYNSSTSNISGFPQQKPGMFASEQLMSDTALANYLHTELG